jgi:hypothetical protein
MSPNSTLEITETKGKTTPPQLESETIAWSRELTALKFRDIICRPEERNLPIAQQIEQIGKDLIRRFEPRDPVEEMLIAQMVWAHARVSQLMVQAVTQSNLKWHALMGEQADRAANLFRRQCWHWQSIAAPAAEVSPQFARQTSPNNRWSIQLEAHVLFKKKKKRKYHLTRRGLLKLQIAAHRDKPWLKSTGPHTLKGKVIARQNRLVHGLYSRGFEEERKKFERFLKELKK